MRPDAQRTLDAIEALLVSDMASVRDALTAAYLLGQWDTLLKMPPHKQDKPLTFSIPPSVDAPPSTKEFHDLIVNVQRILKQ
jgi:hypothetical protein